MISCCQLLNSQDIVGEFMNIYVISGFCIYASCSMYCKNLIIYTIIYVLIFVTQMKESGYDQKVNETVSVVATKSTEIGQRTWGIMKGVMAMASQKVEEYSNEGISWKVDDWSQKESVKNGYYQEFGQDNKSWNSPRENPNKHYNSVSSSWDNWDEKERREEPRKGTQSSESWAGWDDMKDDDGYANYHYSSSNNAANQNGKSGSSWTDGGFL